jgi:hypothetical protein
MDVLRRCFLCAEVNHRNFYFCIDAFHFLSSLDVKILLLKVPNKCEIFNPLILTLNKSYLGRNTQRKERCIAYKIKNNNADIYGYPIAHKLVTFLFARWLSSLLRGQRILRQDNYF